MSVFQLVVLEKMKPKIINFVGVLLLFLGIVLTIYPFFLDDLGAQSGLFAFVLIFVGVSLLKYRKDQLNK